MWQFVRAAIGTNTLTDSDVVAEEVGSHICGFYTFSG